MLLLQHFTKQCYKCNELKLYNEFSSNIRKKDGINTYCKKCCNSEYRVLHPKKIIQEGFKFCNKCKSEKLFIEFGNNTKGINNLDSRCNDCRKIYRSENKNHISIKSKEYRNENRIILNSYNKNWRILNYEKHKQSLKNNYILNRDKRLKDAVSYYQYNKEKIRIYRKAYSKTEIAKAVDKNKHHKRRAKTNQGDVTSQQLLKLQQNAKVCYWCNTPLKVKKAHIDHYIPLSKGGEHTISNLVVSCAKCNLTKNAKDPIVFANSIGRLL